MNKLDCGVIGLSTMGRNLALNLADHAMCVGIYNRTQEVTEKIVAEGIPDNVLPYVQLKELIQAMKRPRRLFLMVKAGAAVDEVLIQILPLLEVGDIVLDCGNSHFEDTEKRMELAKRFQVHYFGVGISGGEEGARRGPSIMVGGDKAVYDKHLQSCLEAIAAKTEEGKPCCGYMGEKGAGHFVKMVHNGIEYADMQLITEIVLLLKAAGKNNLEIAEIFKQWSQSKLGSYLLEISVDLLRYKNDKHEFMVDTVEDCAAQKGTGRWTMEAALKMQVVVSIITAAVEARNLSTKISLRNAMHNFTSHENADIVIEIDSLKSALLASRILAYDQGFALLHEAKQKYGWTIGLEEIADTFKAGCIIRSELLKEIGQAYSSERELEHMIQSSNIRALLQENWEGLRHAVLKGTEKGIPMMALSSAFQYGNALNYSSMGMNFIQAQRDYFGSHTVKHVDKSGNFHYTWRNTDE